jgi:hypothetical protein
VNVANYFRRTVLSHPLGSDRGRHISTTRHSSCANILPEADWARNISTPPAANCAQTFFHKQTGRGTFQLHRPQTVRKYSSISILQAEHFNSTGRKLCADSVSAEFLNRQRTSQVYSQRSHFVFGRSQVQISARKLAVLFSSVPSPSKCRNITSNYVTTASFHIPSNFSCTSYPTIRSFIV